MHLYNNLKKLKTQLEQSQNSKYAVAGLLALNSVVLIGLQIKPGGWYLLLASIVFLLLCNKDFARHSMLIFLAIGVLGITDISTDISYYHMTQTSLLLSLAVIIPYIFTQFIYKTNHITFTLGNVKNWSKKQVSYIGVAFVASYFLIPLYLQSSGAYINWPNPSSSSELTRLFIGTNGLGIWDELFFVIVVLAILSKYMKFWIANLVQAIMWTAFLYELGFISWAPFMIFPFALLQGYIFKKTHSLLYIVTIHLTVDFVLFLALVNAHQPETFNIFLM